MRLSTLTVLCGLWVLAGPAQGQTYRNQGIGFGGLTGAVIGGIIGHQNDETAEGALIGGAVGAVAGGVLGNQRDQYQQAYNYYHSAPPPGVVSPADVVMMCRNGLSDAVIINQIQTRGITQTLAVHDIISLHQQGVSEAVINAMQSAPVGGAGRVVARPPTTVVVQPSYRVGCPYPPPYPRHYYHHHGRRW